MANGPASAADESLITLITPFTPGVPRADLDDLRERLAWSRWPPPCLATTRISDSPSLTCAACPSTGATAMTGVPGRCVLTPSPAQCYSPPMEVVIQRGVVEILHVGVLVAIHAGRLALRCPPMNGRCRNSSTARAQRRSP
jgi:hypothetical protein